MNLSELKDLPDERLNVMLAELVLKPCESCKKNGYSSWRNLEDTGCNPTPRFCSDLNEVAKVEKGLFEKYHTAEGAEILSQYTKYLVKLEHPLFATARQRTIALILTLQP